MLDRLLLAVSLDVITFLICLLGLQLKSALAAYASKKVQFSALGLLISLEFISKT
jgi:hypothetical protein